MDRRTGARRVGFHGGRMGCDGGHCQSIRQAWLPFRARGFGQRRPRDRLAGHAAGGARRKGRAARRAAGLCQGAQPGRICVRSRLGRRVGAGRGRLLSQAADQRAVHPRHGSAHPWRHRPRPGAARRRPASGRAARLVERACDFHRTGAASPVRGCRLAFAQRYPVPLAQPRLCRFRRVPRRPRQPQAQGDPQGTRPRRRGIGDRPPHRRRDKGRALGRLLGVLPGYRRAKMGHALPDARGVRPVRRAVGGGSRPDAGAGRGRAGGRGAQFHRRGCAVRALSGLHRRPPVPAFRAMLLPGDRRRHRARPLAGGGRGAGRAQACPRL